MKYTIARNIYFYSAGSGLVSKHISKEVTSEVYPQIGFEFEDAAWHGSNPAIAESIRIDAMTGKCTIILDPMRAKSASDVANTYCRAVHQHEWDNWQETHPLKLPSGLHGDT